MINKIYSLVLFISNNELRGNVTPNEFNQALYDAIVEIYEEYLFEINRMVNRLNRGLVNNDFSNLTEYYREKIRYYLKDGTISYLNGSYVLPSDLRYLDGVFLLDIEFEPTANSRQFKLCKKYPELTLDNEFPVYLQKGKSIEVLPITIVDDLDVNYLRNPLVPKWTYTVVDGTEIFNPSANDFQDVDIHESEFSNLTKRVLLKIGINLKDADLTNYMIASENQKYQQENQI